MSIRCNGCGLPDPETNPYCFCPESEYYDELKPAHLKPAEITDALVEELGRIPCEVDVGLGFDRSFESELLSIYTGHTNDACIRFSDGTLALLNPKTIRIRRDVVEKMRKERAK